MVAVTDANITLHRSFEWVVVFRAITFLEIRWLRKNLAGQIYGLDTCIFVLSIVNTECEYISPLESTNPFLVPHYSIKVHSLASKCSHLAGAFWFCAGSSTKSLSPPPIQLAYHVYSSPLFLRCANNAQHYSCSAKITPTPIPPKPK